MWPFSTIKKLKAEVKERDDEIDVLCKGNKELSDTVDRQYENNTSLAAEAKSQLETCEKTIQLLRLELQKAKKNDARDPRSGKYKVAKD